MSTDHNLFKICFQLLVTHLDLRPNERKKIPKFVYGIKVLWGFPPQ